MIPEPDLEGKNMSENEQTKEKRKIDKERTRGEESMSKQIINIK